MEFSTGLPLIELKNVANPGLIDPAVEAMARIVQS